MVGGLFSNNGVKKYLLLLIITVFLISISSVVFASQKSKIMLIDLHYKDGTFEIKDVKIKQGYIPNKLHTKGKYEYKLYTDEFIYSKDFELPSTIYADYLENGKLTGKVIELEEFDFTIAVPYIKNIKWISFLKNNSFLSTKDFSKYEKMLITAAEGDNCVTLVDNGPEDEKLDILFLGHDYNESYLEYLKQNVTSNYNYLFSLAPFDVYKKNINIRYLNETSNVRCYYNCNNIPRLICCNYTLVMDAASECPYDEIIVLVNNETYGGSGGAFAVSYNGAAMEEVVTHELGHSFGHLMDEYSYGTTNPNPPTRPNCAFNYSGNSTMACPKWDWAEGLPDIGCYLECSYTNYYRPTNHSCMMHSLQPKFCAVCQKALSSSLDAYNDEFNRSLKLGWNLISMPLNLFNKTISEILNGINYDAIYTYSNNNYILVDSNDVINSSNGYWINSITDQNMTINGPQFNSYNISLEQGRNLIGYPSFESKDISTIFSDINDSLVNVMTYNPDSWFSYSPTKTLNSIVSALPGFGYFVDVNESVILEIS